MSIAKNVLLNWYCSMKKNSEDDLWAQKIDFESQILALFAINAKLKVQQFTLGMLILRQFFF